ncbi:hypothetical protein BX616_005805 [Lobosporangium transversale]|nr:hypothetical protein BX616_005805 [Lobosporangium transversale]
MPLLLTIRDALMLISHLFRCYFAGRQPLLTTIASPSLATSPLTTVTITKTGKFTAPSNAQHIPSKKVFATQTKDSSISYSGLYSAVPENVTGNSTSSAEKSKNRSGRTFVNPNFDKDANCVFPGQDYVKRNGRQGRQQQYQSSQQAVHHFYHYMSNKNPDFKQYKPFYPSPQSKERHDRKSVFLPYVKDIDAIPEDVRYWHDEKHFIIKDRFPKSTVHLLVMPRVQIEKLYNLSGEEGIATVKGLKERGEWLIQRLKTDFPHLSFTMGFHTFPSMLQIHLHVISTDFCGASMRTPWHFNSFTTEYFIHPEDMLRFLEKRRSFQLARHEVLQYKKKNLAPLKCNQCETYPANMYELKKHLGEHLQQQMLLANCQSA